MRRSKYKDLNEEYEAYQKKWLAFQDGIALGKMYELLCLIEYKYVSKYCLSHRVYFDRDMIEDIVEDAAIFVIKRHLKDITFRIEKMSSYSHFGFLRAMFNRSKLCYETHVACSYEEYMQSIDTQDELLESEITV